MDGGGVTAGGVVKGDGVQCTPYETRKGRLMRDVTLTGVLLVGCALLCGCAGRMASVQVYDESFRLPAGYDTSHLWIGMKVAFLPQYELVRQDVYPSYSFEEDGAGHPSYDVLVGRTAEVIGYRSDSVCPRVILKVDTLDWVLYTQAVSGMLSEVGFVSEMEKAREFVGRRVWKKGHPPGADADWYDYISGSRQIDTAEGVVIRDIEWSTNDSNPLRFIVETNDDVAGRWDGVFSRINAGRSNQARLFEDSWFLEDPHEVHADWPQRVWDTIQSGKVMPGMTAEQVLVSWGKPSDVNRLTGTWKVREQWVYDSHDLRFENGTLVSFESR